MISVAVFDVDGTLIRDNIGITFVKFLNGKGAISVRSKIVVMLGYVLYKMRLLGFRTAIRLGDIALIGLCEERVRELALECFDNEIRPRLFADGLEEISRLKRQGYTVILATGAHEAIAGPLAEFVGADDLVCSRTAVRNGKYTGALISPVPYGQKKRDLVRRLIETRLPEQGTQVTVYTDEAKDLPLFDLANICVGVNADQAIQRAVKSKGGTLLTFR